MFFYAKVSSSDFKLFATNKLHNFNMAKKYFGTDGIRGRVGDAPITPEFMLRLGWAIAMATRNTKNNKNLILIGKDTRRSGYMFESALQAGIMNAGVSPGLLGPIPTPAISHLTRTMHAVAGIVISASHNPHYDNGIKIFDANGQKISDELETIIENYIDNQQMVSVAPEKMLKAVRISDANGRYIEFCKNTVDNDFWLDGTKIVLDCANGATYKVAPEVFSELGAEVIVINNTPDGLNINENCGSTQLYTLQTKVLKEQADLGVAFDGDGDRVLFVDSEGSIVDGDVLILIISNYYKTRGSLSGVVGTLMTNYALEEYYKQQKIPFVRSNVGDRHVLKLMNKHKYNLGGENSGHIICGDASSTGDGIVAALQVIQALKAIDEPLTIGRRLITLVPQFLENIKINKQIKKITNKSLLDAIAEANKKLENSGRVLIRPSGTEALIRVMVESRDVSKGHSITQDLVAVVKEHYCETFA